MDCFGKMEAIRFLILNDISLWYLNRDVIDSGPSLRVGLDDKMV
jgi:hypothetical protein